MRNRSTPIFLYPPKPADEIKGAHELLAHELAAQSYRVLPETYTNLNGQLRNSALSVFLFGQKYDEDALQLTQIAAAQTKPWVVWSAPVRNDVGGGGIDIDQMGLLRYVEQMQSASKTYLSSNIPPETLKQEVMALLRPDSRTSTPADGKPRVYLVYNARDFSEAANAGLIKLHYRNDFQFEIPDDPAQHTSRLMRSDGVVLIWGNAGEDWCSREFAQIAQTAGRRGGQALCVFDPRESKIPIIGEIRRRFQNFYVAEQFGPKFDPGRLDPYFDPIRRSAEAK